MTWQNPMALSFASAKSLAPRSQQSHFAVRPWRKSFRTWQRPVASLLCSRRCKCCWLKRAERDSITVNWCDIKQHMYTTAVKPEETPPNLTRHGWYESCKIGGFTLGLLHCPTNEHVVDVCWTLRNPKVLGYQRVNESWEADSKSSFIWVAAGCTNFTMVYDEWCCHRVLSVLNYLPRGIHHGTCAVRVNLWPLNTVPSILAASQKNGRVMVVGSWRLPGIQKLRSEMWKLCDQKRVWCFVPRFGRSKKASMLWKMPEVDGITFKMLQTDSVLLLGAQHEVHGIRQWSLHLPWP